MVSMMRLKFSDSHVTSVLTLTLFLIRDQVEEVIYIYIYFISSSLPQMSIFGLIVDRKST